MKKIILSFALAGLLIAEDEVLDKIEVKDASGTVFGEQFYYDSQTYLQNAPAQQRLSITEAMAIPGVMSDPLKALQTLAGVSVASSFSGELIIHGSKAYETFYTYNYLPLGYTFHLGGVHSVVSPDAIEQLDVYLGAFDVTYGNAMGGVVDITPKLPTGTNSGHVHVGLFDSSASIDYKINDQFALYIGGRRSYFDLVFDIVNPQIPGFNITTFPNYYDLTTILSYIPNNNNIFSFEAIVAKDTTDLTKETVTPCNPDFVGVASTMQSFRTYGVRWKYDNFDNFKSNTVFAYGAKKDKTDVFSQIQSEENYHDFKLTNTSTLETDEHKLSIGFEGSSYYHPYDYKLPAAFLADDEYSGTAQTIEVNGNQIFENYALYAQDVYSLGDVFKFRYGARANYTPYQSFGTVVDPRMALIVQLPTQSFSLGMGQYSQFPVFSRMLDLFSNSDLEYEKALHLSLKYKYEFAAGHSLEVEPYYKEYTDLSVKNSLGKYTMVSNGYTKLLGSESLGYARGVDTTYKYRTDDLYLYGTYSYLDASRKYSETGALETFTDEIPHTLQLAASYKLNDSWTLGTLARYKSGLLYDKPISVITTTTEDGTCYKKNETTQIRLDDYFTLNVKATNKQKLSSTSSIEYSFELMNVTFHKNISGYAINQKTGAIEESLDVLSIPFLPWFDVTYRF